MYNNSIKSGEKSFSTNDRNISVKKGNKSGDIYKNSNKNKNNINNNINGGISNRRGQAVGFTPEDYPGSTPELLALLNDVCKTNGESRLDNVNLSNDDNGKIEGKEKKNNIKLYEKKDAYGSTIVSKVPQSWYTISKDAKLVAKENRSSSEIHVSNRQEKGNDGKEDGITAGDKEENEKLLLFNSNYNNNVSNNNKKNNKNRNNVSSKKNTGNSTVREPKLAEFEQIKNKKSKKGSSKQNIRLTSSKINFMNKCQHYMTNSEDRDTSEDTDSDIGYVVNNIGDDDGKDDGNNDNENQNENDKLQMKITDVLEDQDKIRVNILKGRLRPHSSIAAQTKKSVEWGTVTNISKDYEPRKNAYAGEHVDLNIAFKDPRFKITKKLLGILLVMFDC